MIDNFGGKMTKLGLRPLGTGFNIKHLHGLESIEFTPARTPKRQGESGWFGCGCDFLLWTLLLPNLKELKCHKLNAFLRHSEKDWVKRTKLQHIAFDQCNINVAFLEMLINTSPALQSLSIEKPYGVVKLNTKKIFNKNMHQLRTRCSSVFEERNMRVDCDARR